ncbi:MAG: TauD/TfdA family dioxygenase [Actinomycetota bacterium]
MTAAERTAAAADRVVLTSESAVQLDLRPLSGALGAEVFGLDLSTDLTDGQLAAIRTAFHTHHVLAFRDQDLSPEQQLRFGKRFGELDTHPFVHGNPEHPEILDIVTEPDDRINFGGGWHTDVTFLEEPDLGSILYGIEIPPVGGDTLFANQHLAYEALSNTMQGMLDGLTAIHTAAMQYSPGGLSTQSNAMETKNADRASETVEHPVIRTHPETGRKGLYVNRAFTARIRGLRVEESRALLDFLCDHAVKEAFTCRLRWEPGTLAMWDNRSVQHYALHDYAGHRRVMRRITVKGDRPT